MQRVKTAKLRLSKTIQQITSRYRSGWARVRDDGKFFANVIARIYRVGL